MSHKIAIHKGATHFPDTPWWMPFFTMQRNMAHAACALTLGKLPVRIWQPQEDALVQGQQMLSKILSEMYNQGQALTSLIQGGQAAPLIDIIESDNSYTVRVEIPGVALRDLDLSVADNVLIIRGERPNCASSAQLFMRQECNAGSFTRLVSLPVNADLVEASASCSEHVLTVDIPKHSPSLFAEAPVSQKRKRG